MMMSDRSVGGGVRREAMSRLEPDRSPVVGSALVSEGHGVPVLVATPSDAAHQSPQPRSAINAVDGATTMPLRLSREHQIVETEILVWPFAQLAYMKRVDCHFCLLPLFASIPCTK